MKLWGGLVAGCAALLALVGCVSEEEMSAMGEGFGNVFGQLVADAFSNAHDITFACEWYRQVEGNWPQTEEELKAFIAERDAPINLQQFENMTFTEKPDGALKVQYTTQSEPGKNEQRGELTMRPEADERAAGPAAAEPNPVAEPNGDAELNHAAEP